MEAMSVGRPLIAVNFSGPTEFMTEANSLPVNYTLTREPGREGHWAEPSLQSLRHQMRWVYNNRDLAEKIGVAGRRTMVEQFSHEVIARKFEMLMLDMNREIDERDKVVRKEEL